jgi:hypothetical protein
MKISTLLLFGLALAGTSWVHAQEPPPGPPPPPPHMGGGMRGGGFGPFGMGMHGGKTVTGAPYSADVNNSMVQTLSDGNTITHTTTGHVARDGQGRTSFQVTMTGGPFGEKGPKTITFISDPVAGYTYVLDAEKKVAMKRPLRAHEGMRPPRPANSEPGESEHNGASQVEADLGQQVINGLNAQGKSITRTIAAGAMGNAQPLIEKSEVWTAPDLQVVVLAKHSDPRMGVSTYTLNNIQRGEPNASLFQVPSDYAIKDGPKGPGPGAPPAQ